MRQSNQNLPDPGLIEGAVQRLRPSLDHLAQTLFLHPETAKQEQFACQLLCNFLMEHDFKITKGIADLPTAFCAEWNNGGPHLGILAEYDALPDRFQAPDTPEECHGDGPGHACGHNLIGAVSVVSAVAAKIVAESCKIPITIKVFGCPGEEIMYGKPIMAAAGIFQGLDAAIAWHPEDFNGAAVYRCNAISMTTYSFQGQAAHAAAAPQEGRSALDACELMNIGVNYLREHVPPGCRFHYAYLSAPSVPNVVPEYAALCYHIRGASLDMVASLRHRIDNIAKGAALMTETRINTEETLCVPETTPNITLSAAAANIFPFLMQEYFTHEEQKFAAQLLKNAGKNIISPALSNEFRPFDGGIEQRMGSSDIASVSCFVPTVMLRSACVPIGIPQHHWAFAASCGSAIGRKGARNGVRMTTSLLLNLAMDQDVLCRANQELQQTHSPMKGASSCVKI